MSSPHTNGARRRSWRLWVVSQMDRAARALEFFSIAVMSPQDIIERNRRYFMTPAIVSATIKMSDDGLYEEEEMLLGRFVPKAGKALVLGCGAGREAIALAKRGWEVVAIDNAPALMAAGAMSAVQAGVQIEWLCLDVTQKISLDRSFDLISLFGVYTLIPGRKRRVQLLTACRQWLKPEGHCLVVFNMCDSPSRLERWMHRLRLVLAWLVGGNRGCQLGDYYGRAFQHYFSSLTEFAEEAAAAGLVMIEGGEKERVIKRGTAVLRLAAK